MVVKCGICHIDFQDEYSYQGHLKGKKHLKKLEQTKVLESIINRSIFVSQLPSFLTKSNILLQYFAQIGKIENHRFASNSLIVEFSSPEPVNFLLSKPIFFKNIRLNISRRIINEKPFIKKEKNKEPEVINNTDELDHKNLKCIFNEEATFDEQLAAFLDAVSISSYEIETRYETTCNKLNDIFQKAYPQCQTYRFGSTVSGLGFKNCDLDIYMNIGRPITQDNQSKSNSNAVPAATVFSDVKKILYSKSNLFSNVVPIPRAKTPIIKFTYLPTKISCDISFKNCLAVYNSQLVKYCLSLDHRLWPAMMVLKYWVCNFELHGGSKMSKYALTLLFLFYCQQPTVKLVPAIIDLKKKCKPEVVESWQVNFDSSVTKSVPVKEDISVPELLHGFFNFYANYNFKMNVVCLIDGLSHNKLILNSVETIPSSMNRYKDYLTSREDAFLFPLTKPMCVQDPNELNHNVTGNICPRYLETFQKYCTAAAEICDNAVKNDYKQLLPSIFSLIIESKPKDLPNISFLLYANNQSITVGLPSDFASRTDIEDKQSFINENWLNLAVGLVQKYLEKVLKLQVQLCIEQEIKQQKTDPETDVHSTSQNKVVFHCVGEYCLWRDRKGIFNIDPSISLLEKEICISDNIYEQLSSNTKIQKTKIDFECHILKKNVKNAHLIISLHNRECTKSIYHEISSYLRSKVPHVLGKTLAHMVQFKKKSIDL